MFSQTVEVPVCPAPGTPVAEPYRWYPALDLARIPFHTAAGPWGARARIASPAPPVTHRTVHVTSAAQLATEALTRGTIIIVAAEFIGPAIILGDVQDVDIVVPRGRTLAQLGVGRFNPPSVTRRFRIRGTTPGEHSGGVVGNIGFHSDPVTDVIIDGVDLNGADGSGGNVLWQFARNPERVAVVNIRGHAVGAASQQIGGNDMVFAGNRIMAGARPREVNGKANFTGWVIRGGDRIVVHDNRFESTRYHLIRVHPRPGPLQYAWVSNNTLVDRHEARIFNAFDLGHGSRIAAVWVTCNQIYAHSTCHPPSLQATGAQYAVLANNTFYGSFTDSFQHRAQSREGANRDYLTGNTYLPWREPPAWTAPGDPATAVPLPPVNPLVHDPSLRVGPCPPP